MNNSDLLTYPFKQFNDVQIPNLNDLIIYDEGGVIALNKPPGLCSQGARGGEFTIANGSGMLANAHWPEKPRLVHRLDRYTSGVILLARNKNVARSLHKAFSNREIKKEYWAIVDGVPPHQSGQVNAPIEKKKSSTRVSYANGQPASTEYQIFRLSTLFNVSLLKMRPKTGRRHQLRLHAAQVLNLPMLGDKNYHPFYKYDNGGALSGTFAAHVIDPSINDQMQGQMLHARSITFTHPKTREKTTIQAPLPPARSEIWGQLGFEEGIL